VQCSQKAQAMHQGKPTTAHSSHMQCTQNCACAKVGERGGTSTKVSPDLHALLQMHMERRCPEPLLIFHLTSPHKPLPACLPAASGGSHTPCRAAALSAPDTCTSTHSCNEKKEKTPAATATH
jgi:hypothetical protein